MTISCNRRRSVLVGLTTLLGIMFTLAFATAVPAQVVSDPRIAEFDPSPDHSTVLGNGEAAVLRYELGVYLVGAAAPFTTVNMGKPSPESDGKIRYDFSSGVVGWPLPGGHYEARVSAVGPEGEALSDPSNAFTFGTTSSCTISLSATTVAVPATGGSYSVGVSNSGGCSWTVSMALTWVTVWTSSGSGSGTVPFDVKANSSTSTRTGTITIGGQALTLRQDGLAASTTPTVSPAAYELTVVRPSGGMVYSAGIGCGTSGTACHVAMNSNMLLGLQATPDAGYAFSGWTGDCSGTSPGYWLALNGSKSCGATFTALQTAPSTPTTSGPSVPAPVDSAPPIGGPYSLTIVRPSGGVVKSAGIDCGTRSQVCTVAMPGPMTIGLQATADQGYVFLAWTGNCSGASSSSWLALEGPRTCGATFTQAGGSVIEPVPSAVPVLPAVPAPTTPAIGGTLPTGAPYTLTVTRPTGGTIQAAGINCGTGAGLCSVTMPAALLLGLQATPDRGYTFAAWTGHCSGPQTGYFFALAGPRTCGATFKAGN